MLHEPRTRSTAVADRHHRWVMAAEAQRTGEPERPAHTGPNGYLPIAEHGLVGDLHSAALVGTDGTIDWYCPERFDAPSVFAALRGPPGRLRWQAAWAAERARSRVDPARRRSAQLPNRPGWRR